MAKMIWTIERGLACVGFPGPDKGMCWVSDIDPRALLFETKHLAQTFVDHNKLKDVEVRMRKSFRPANKVWEPVPQPAPEIRGKPRSIYQAPCYANPPAVQVEQKTE